MCYEVCVVSQVYPEKDFESQYFLDIRKRSDICDFTDGDCSYDLCGKFDSEEHYLYHLLSEAISYAKSFHSIVKFTSRNSDFLSEFTNEEIEELLLNGCMEGR